MAQITQENQINLIHFSTDYVYGGKQNQPFKETDATQPTSVYGQTKLEGEKKAREANPNTLILRTSWVYGGFGKNFLKTMIRLGNLKPELNVVYDQIGTPTYTDDIVDSVLSIIAENPRAAVRGIYNYSNEGVTSWYDFAQSIFEIENISCQVNPILSEAYPTPARRPPFSLLDKAKIKHRFGLTIPHWRESLKKCLSVYRENLYPMA